MKHGKIFSVVTTALILSALSPLSTSAESYGTGKKLVVLGDSIASGYGLSETEHNYGQICADYVGGSVENYAHAGDETADLLSVLENLSDTQREVLTEADTVIVSIGGNDMIEYASRRILSFSATNSLLKDDYSSVTADEVNATEDLGFQDVAKMVDSSKFAAYAEDPVGGMNIISLINSLERNLAWTAEQDTESRYEHRIENLIIPDIEKAVSDIKGYNPDAEIIVQTVYNPLEVSPDYFKDNVNGDAEFLVNKLSTAFKNILASFGEQLSGVEGIEVADVNTAFSSEDESGNRYTWYFTDIQEEGNERDFHPNQRGHLAIACEVLETMGEKSDNGGLVREVFSKISDSESYPAKALESVNNLRGTYIFGDIDGDIMVDAGDASAILAEYALLSTGGTPSFTAAQKGAGDINGDGNVDAGDASTVLGYYAYLSTGGNNSFRGFLNS